MYGPEERRSSRPHRMTRGAPRYCAALTALVAVSMAITGTAVANTPEAGFQPGVTVNVTRATTSPTTSPCWLSGPGSAVNVRSTS